VALNAACVFEVRTTGSDNNGGGFRTGASGTDRSQQDAAHATLTTSSTVHTTTTQINVAVGDYTVTANDVGNIVQVTGGTATAGFYEITTVDTGNNRWTVDRSVGTAGQTVAGAMGGALATPGKSGSVPLVSGNKIWIKAGTYSITSASTNVANGCFASTSPGVYIEGYNSSRGDLGTKPLLQASGISTFTLISFTTNNAHMVANVSLDGASLTSSQGLSIRNIGYRVHVANCTNGAFVSNLSAVAKFIECSATGCSSQPVYQAGNCFYCTAYDNTVSAFEAASAETVHVACIADSNSGATTDGFLMSGGTSSNGPLINCVAYNNGRDGFRLSAVRGGLLMNCIAESNAAYGFDLVSNISNVQLMKCAGYNNTTANTNIGTGTNVNNLNFITGSGSFFTNAASQNFTLNNTAGAGAVVREVADPTTFPGMSSTTNFGDVGAAQAEDGTGGGGGGEISHVF
jgi:hypothetical protein